MKLRKILAAVAAAAVAVSTMAMNTFALSAADYYKADGNNTVYINADKPEDPSWVNDSGVDITTIYGVTYHVTLGDEEWIGGGIGANSPSTGWGQFGEWATSDKPIVVDMDNGTITYLSDSPIFAADDIYAQFWLQCWGGTATVTSVDILGAGGTVLSTDAAPADTGSSTPAADGDTASKTTGNVPAAAMVSVMALAGAAAVATKKRK